MSFTSFTNIKLDKQIWKLLKDVSKSDEGIGGQSTIEVNDDMTIIKKQYNKRDHKYYKNERLILANVSHPNIIKLLGYDDDTYTLYLPYYKKGCAFNYYKENETIDLSDRYDILYKLYNDMLSALHYLYKNNITHRDIKLENILLDEDGTHILCDFGLSKPQIYKMTKTCGTYNYMAPELYYLGKNNNKTYDYKIDIFSLGSLIIELGNGDSLFYDEYRQRFKRVYKELGDFYENKEEKLFNKIWYSMDKWTNFRKILKAMIHPDPLNRILYDDIYKMLDE